MDGNQHKVEANVLLLGAENVGKSALTVRFLTRRFIGEYGDIESIYSHIDKTDGREIALNIWDSLYPQSCETTESISDKQMQWADGVILVYSICDRSSFEVVRQQVQLIHTFALLTNPHGWWKEKYKKTECLKFRAQRYGEEKQMKFVTARR
uniref:small monomeric GTPase n=1 Tax=Sinocyclocheilus rhinocerous TaxID=307959 RepID=A0A673K566_9TELE